MRQITDIKELRQIQMGILDHLHQFCTSHQIKYSLAFGTMLGAIRHKGYIPWDDDIDICMPRADYERFLKCYQDTAYFQLKDRSRSKDYYFTFAKVVDSRTYLVEDEIEGYHIGVWVDIFPIDYVADSPGSQKRTFFFKNVLYKMRMCKLLRGNRKTLLEHLILYENCQLNAPIVKATCNKIINDYPHYAVVTVMHRGFEDLSWKEKNNCDPLSVDAIGYIEDVSDIIITGHDHTINTAPPTLIKNRIQHFRLGSVGRKEPVSTEHIRTASIIRFYPTGKFIEMLNLSYKKDQNGERRWFFTPDNNTYPLYSKYDRNSVSLRLFENYIPIKSQSIKKEDILKAIEKHFILHSDVTLHVVEANAETMMEELREIAKENDGVKYIVVYFIRHLFFPQNIEELTEYRIKVEEGIRTFEKENKNLFILNRLIINKVYIQIPIFYTQNKK